MSSSRLELWATYILGFILSAISLLGAFTRFKNKAFNSGGLSLVHWFPLPGPAPYLLEWANQSLCKPMAFLEFHSSSCQSMPTERAILLNTPVCTSPVHSTCPNRGAPRYLPQRAALCFFVGRAVR